MLEHIIAVILATLLDRWIGDPKWLPHPVVGIGRIITWLDKRLNTGSHRILKGTITSMVTTLIAFILSLIIVYGAYKFHPFLGIVIEAIIIFTTIAQKSLASAAMEVYKPLKSGQLDTAREKLGWIVGRDTDRLEEGEIVRGVVETVAENTSDGITAPIFYALIGGAPLAMFYRAVNTLDSMLGYKNEKYLLFGRASAKWDDWMNLIPSRLTGFCMVFANITLSANSFTKTLSILVSDAKKHPSPNSGWGEAAMASLLGVELGGTNYYKGVISIRFKMGHKINVLQEEHIPQAILIMNRTIYFFTTAMIAIGGILYVLSDAWG